MDIFIIKTDGVRFDNISRLCRAVTAPRRARIERMRQESDKINSLVGELLLLREISRRTGIPRREIEFGHGRFGKPFLKGYDGVCEFSLSHTRGAVCAAFSSAGEVGIDIERADRAVRDAVKTRVLCESEAALCADNAAFLRVWVKKEAFLKRLGVGITRDLRTLDAAVLPDTYSTETNGFILGVSHSKGDGAKSAAVSDLRAVLEERSGDTE